MKNISDRSEKINRLCEEFKEISSVLDERRIRLWCAARARAYNRQYGRGGVMIVHQATGVSRSRIYGGMKEIEEQHPLPAHRIRRSGGGRKKNCRKAARNYRGVRKFGRTSDQRGPGISSPMDMQKYLSPSG